MVHTLHTRLQLRRSTYAFTFYVRKHEIVYEINSHFLSLSKLGNASYLQTFIIGCFPLFLEREPKIGSYLLPTHRHSNPSKFLNDPSLFRIKDYGHSELID